MLPIRSNMPPRQTHFPSATVQSTLAKDVLLDIVRAAKYDPETLIALATTCQGLWEAHGNESIFASYLFAVESAYPSFPPEAREEVPAKLLSLLFNSMRLLPEEMVLQHLERIVSLGACETNETVPLAIQMQTPGKMLDVCRGVMQGCQATVATDHGAAQLQAVCAIAVQRISTLYSEKGAQIKQLQQATPLAIPGIAGDYPWS